MSKASGGNNASADKPPAKNSGAQEITFGAMRASGVRNVLIYCADHRCSHCTTVEACADRWPDEVRLSDIEDKFVLHGL